MRKLQRPQFSDGTFSAPHLRGKPESVLDVRSIFRYVRGAYFKLQTSSDSWSLMRVVALLLAVTFMPPAFAASDTFALGAVQAPSDKTAKQEQLDIQMCKDQAHSAAVSAGQQTKEFLLRLTIIGESAALESDKAKQREVLKSCLEARGYVVKPAPEQATDTSSALNTAAAAPPPVSPVPGIDSLSADWPPGFESKPLSDRQRRYNVAAWAVDRANDITVILIADRHAGIIDVPTYAASRRAAMLSQLQDASAADIVRSQIGGRPAYRFEGGGLRNGIQIKTLETIIEGTEQLIIVLAWTSPPNWPSRADLMRGLPAKVIGIR